jgi:hypothetical protein
MAYANITPGLNTLHVANVAKYIDVKVKVKVNTAVE